MPLDEKEKKRFVAIARAMKSQKGYIVKQNELQTDISSHKEAQKKLDKVKEEYSDCPAVIKEADQQKQKLQNIIDDLNDYMRVLHPEGLLDMGSGNSGTVVSQG
ncbi:MAG: hypothetical protein OXU45_00165 [Candidatus Melainabacteria bacterium]|nr:hypothetical protein [Candidatus Melainabacteria bacterium]